MTLSDSNFFAPLRNKHKEEHLFETWSEYCEQYLRDEGYTEQQIIEMEDLITESIEEMQYDHEVDAVEILKSKLEDTNGMALR